MAFETSTIDKPETLDNKETTAEPEATASRAEAGRPEEPQADNAQAGYQKLIETQASMIEAQNKRIDSLMSQIGQLVANGAYVGKGVADGKADVIDGSIGEALEQERRYAEIKPEDLRI